MSILRSDNRTKRGIAFQHSTCNIGWYVRNGVSMSILGSYDVRYEIQREVLEYEPTTTIFIPHTMKTIKSHKLYSSMLYLGFPGKQQLSGMLRQIFSQMFHTRYSMLFKVSSKQYWEWCSGMFSLFCGTGISKNISYSSWLSV